ncbi:hypothetical protein SRHO_G00340610 [Serrasalmus rhombeus]
MRLYLKCVEDIRREIATLPLQITDFYMFLFIEFLGTKTVALVPKSWGKHDVRILKSCNKLFQRFQLEVIQLQYPGSPLLQGCTNLSGRGRGQEQRVFPALRTRRLEPRKNGTRADGERRGSVSGRSTRGRLKMGTKPPPPAARFSPTRRAARFHPSARSAQEDDAGSQRGVNHHRQPRSSSPETSVPRPRTEEREKAGKNRRSPSAPAAMDYVPSPPRVTALASARPVT